MAADQPKGVKITSYQVGFGDCYLLSFRYADGDRHVLMDFGTKFRSQSGFKANMPTIAKKIAEDCGNKLTMVVATHRHYDHISGFETKKDGSGPGDTIRGLKPDIVIQPWTEIPDLAKNALEPKTNENLKLNGGHAQTLNDMQALADAIAHDPTRLMAARKAKKKNSEMDELDYLGGDNITNKSSVENLMTMGKRPPKYLHLGSKLDVSSLLPGVKIHVLGPPTIKQARALKQNLERYATTSDEYWKLQARVASGELQPAGKSGLSGRVKAVPPSEARWFAKRLRKVREDGFLQIVRTLDKTINNTSLILLIEVGGKKLLFPGDAQLENWLCALADKKILDLLSDVNVYKVGHHGSFNATPRTMWKRISDGNKSLLTLVSTRAHEYGHIPLEALDTELKKASHFISTADLKEGKSSISVDV